MHAPNWKGSRDVIPFANPSRELSSSSARTLECSSSWPSPPLHHLSALDYHQHCPPQFLHHSNTPKDQSIDHLSHPRTKQFNRTSEVLTPKINNNNILINKKILLKYFWGQEAPQLCIIMRRGVFITLTSLSVTSLYPSLFGVRGIFLVDFFSVSASIDSGAASCTEAWHYNWNEPERAQRPS